MAVCNATAGPGRCRRRAATVGRRKRLRVWRTVLALTMAVVVPVAGLVAETSAAWAGGLSTNSADPSGNYAVCEVVTTAVSNAAMESGSYPTDLLNASNAYGWAEAYAQGYDYSVNCNTAWTTGSWEISVDDQNGGTSHFETWLGSESSADTCATGSSTGNVEGVCEGDYVGSTSPGIWYCVDPSIEADSHWSGLSSFDQNYFRVTECGNHWKCAVSGSTGGPLVDQCSIESVHAVTDVSASPASEPNTYWTGQEVPVPVTPTPPVTCSMDIDHAHDSVELSGASAVSAGTTDAYTWEYGDGASGSALAESHTYSAGGTYTAVLTVVATGDGVTYEGTSTGTCTLEVDFTSGTGGSTGSASPPGPPTSCGWTDVLCSIEAAVGWLIVPGSTFFTAWSSFETTMETKAPFAYVVGTATWIYDFIGDVNTGVESTPECWDVPQLSASVPATCAPISSSSNGWLSAVRDMIGIVVVLGTVALVWAEGRRVLGEH